MNKHGYFIVGECFQMILMNHYIHDILHQMIHHIELRRFIGISRKQIIHILFQLSAAAFHIGGKLQLGMIQGTVFVNKVGIQFIQMPVLLYIYQHITAANHCFIVIAVQCQVLTCAFQQVAGQIIQMQLHMLLFFLTA